MNSRAPAIDLRALQGVVCAVLVVVVSNGCQILGCEPRRCQLDDEVGACADGEVCSSDGFCRPRAVELPCGAPPAPATRSLSVRISPNIGVEAMGNELFGVTPEIVSDVRGCTVELGRPLCPIELASRPRGVVQPLGALSAPGAEAFAPLLSNSRLSHAHDGAVDVTGAFAVEVLFRTPTNGGDGDVVGQFVPDDGGWRITMRNGQPLFAAGDRAVILAGRSDGTWRHVLCVVDAAGITAATLAGEPAVERDETDIVCIVDGAVAPSAPAAFSDLADLGFTDGAAPIVLGELGAAGDPAVVVVRVWNGDVLDAVVLDDDRGGDDAARAALHDDALATTRITALAEEARGRLARYVGLRVAQAGGGAAVFTSTNLDLGIARAQPIEHGRFQRHEYVGGGWPRVTHTAQGLPALLLEPIRADLLEAAWSACAPSSRSEILGRSEGCDQDDAVLTRTVSIPGQLDRFGVPAPVALVFSVFGDLADGSPEFVVDGVTVCTGSTTTEEDGCEVEVFEDDETNFVRLVHRFSVGPGPTTLDLALRANGVIWSPQLEDGVDPTTPMNGQGAVILDQILVRAPLAAGNASLRATVASDGSNIIMAPITVVDGGARFGRAASLVTVARDAGEEGEQLFFAALTDVEGVQDLIEPAQSEPFPFLGGVPVHGGVDIGAPVDDCPDCTVAPLGITLAGDRSWHTVLFQGVLEPGFLISGDVLTEGTAPLPIALDVTVAAPAGGCLEHRVADVSFVACDETTACSENERLVWEGEASEAGLIAGPSIDERAVAGVFQTGLPATTVDDDTALLVEVRFRRDGGAEDANDEGGDEGGDDAVVRRGHVLSLLSADDDVVLRVEDDDGDAILTTSAGAHTLRDAWGAGSGAEGEGEWAQLTCIIAAGLRCTVNAGEPVDVDVRLTGAAAPARARVGDDVMPVAFARVWVLPGLGAPSLVEAALPGELEGFAVPVAAARLMDARVAASFGLVAPARPGLFTVVEARASPASVEQGGATHTVGPHWPRVIVGDEGAPVYVAALDGEGLVVTGADLADGLGTRIDASFEDVAPGRFLVLTHDLPNLPATSDAGPLDSLALDYVDVVDGDGEDELHVVIDVSSDEAGPRELISARTPTFDGHTLSLTARLFSFAVASGGRVTFGNDARGIEGGQTLRLGPSVAGSVGGGGVPLTLRALRVSAD